MREFNPQILKSFGLKVKTVKRAFGSHICETNNGLKLVKNTNIPTDKLLFIHSAKEHLYKNGFKNIDRFCVAYNNLPYYEFNKKLYVVKNWIDGEECDLYDFSKVIWAVQNLAKMHNASEGMMPIEGSRMSSQLGVIPQKFERHCRELNHIYKKVRQFSRWNNFDIIFIKNYKNYINDSYKAVQRLKDSNYTKLVNKAKYKKVFCHNKYTNHNIQINNNRLMIINFDYCGYELPLWDLVRFMEKIMRKNTWDIQKGMNILNTYNNIRNISKDDLEIIYSLLLFPDKFWKLCNGHYNTRRNWMPKIFEVKMKSIIEQQENKKIFLEQFKLNL